MYDDIDDSCLYLTLCDYSPSCFDPVYLLLAYLWLGLSWIGCLGGSSCMVKNEGKGRKMTGFQRHQKIVVLMDISKSVTNKYGGLNISIRMMCPMGETGKSIVW